MENKKIYYLRGCIQNAPRLIGLLDRNPASKTYGCFDRNYWHYKTTDFSCARLQEATLTLSLLYKIKHKENPYHNNKTILQWINAALEFWTTIQQKNGSFNEWYINENSFVATAFSAYAISETLLILKNRIENKEIVIKSLERAANWLLKKHEKRVLNQESGAMIALYNVFLLTKNKKYLKSGADKVNFILTNQTKEGWFYEYGGADVGYLSLMIDYLAKYYKKTKNVGILRCLNRSIDFIKYFITPNLTFGGAYTSRNTEYLIPDGFEILSRRNNNAKLICNKIRESIKRKSAISSFALDDRYLCHNLYTYLQAFVDGEETIESDETDKPFAKDFEEAGIKIINNKNTYLIVNAKKGGAFRLFFKKEDKSFEDSGVLCKIKNKGFTSSYINPETRIKKSDKFVEIETELAELKQSLMNPFKNILLKLFQMTFGKIQPISLFIKTKLRDKLIAGHKKTGIKVERKIEFNDDQVVVYDSIPNRNVEQMIVNSKFSFIYVPSSRYFQISDIDSEPVVKKGSFLRRIYTRGKLFIQN